MKADSTGVLASVIRVAGLWFLFVASFSIAQESIIEIDESTGLPKSTRLGRSDTSERQSNYREPGYVPRRETLGYYRVEIDVTREGTLEITETIDAYALGKRIKRGIYREFSLLNVDRYQGSNPYEILSVKRDDSPLDQFFIEAGVGFYQVYMGSMEHYLRKDAWYTYELKYRVSKAVLQYEDHDLLYWNVIPFHWAFPIRDVEIIVRFPEGFVTRDIDIKSGRFGSRDNFALASWQRPLENVITVKASNLSPKNGITLIAKTKPDLVAVGQDYQIGRAHV